MSKLVQTTTSDRLSFQGNYVPSGDKKVAVLHIHGFGGNYCEPKALILAQELEKAGIGFLSVNTRGTGDGSRDERLEEAHLDITAWLKLLIGEGYKEIGLQGHSAGTVKVVRYLFEGELKDKVNKLILISPIDPLGFRTAKGRGDIEGFLRKAQMKINEGRGEELITPDFDHDIISYQTFVSWYRRDDLGRCFEFCDSGYDFPVLKMIKIPTKIIVGSQDEYFHPSNPGHPEEAMAILLKYFPNAEGIIIDGANHSFKGHEINVAKEVVKWVNRSDL